MALIRIDIGDGSNCGRCKKKKVSSQVSDVSVIVQNRAGRALLRLAFGTVSVRQSDLVYVRCIRIALQFLKTIPFLDKHYLRTTILIDSYQLEK